MDPCASHHSPWTNPSFNQWLRCTEVVLVCMVACLKAVGATGGRSTKGGLANPLSNMWAHPSGGVGPNLM